MEQARCIYGSPGCGKTTYLLEVCSTVVRAGASVVFISHTKAAANELKSRLKQTRNVRASTMHSLVYGLCNIQRSEIVTKQALSEFGASIGIPISGDVDPYNEEERTVEDGDEAMSIISRAAAHCINPREEYDASNRPLPVTTFEFLCSSYKKWKSSEGLIDFDDMLQLYLSDPPPFTCGALVVDEAQDFSLKQWRVTQKLSEGATSVVIAGDPDQALFTWGGADPSGMYAFEQNNDADRFVLPQSYRIPRSVHALAMRVRSRIKDREDIQYNPRDFQGKVNYLGSTYGDFTNDVDTLVLYRTHSVRKEIENELIDSSVPFRTLSGFPSPWDGAFGRAVVAYNVVQKGGKATAAQQRLLDRYCLTSTITGRPWHQAMSFPYRFTQYMIDTERIESKVRLSTIHGAKGMEADNVVINPTLTQRVMDGMIDDPDSEHRVFYVGVTRARQQLNILSGDMEYEL